MEFQACKDFHGRRRSDVPRLPDGDIEPKAAVGTYDLFLSVDCARSRAGRDDFRYNPRDDIKEPARTVAICKSRKRSCSAPAGESGAWAEGCGANDLFVRSHRRFARDSRELSTDKASDYGHSFGSCCGIDWRGVAGARAV